MTEHRGLFTVRALAYSLNRRTRNTPGPALTCRSPPIHRTSAADPDGHRPLSHSAWSNALPPNRTGPSVRHQPDDPVPKM